MAPSAPRVHRLIAQIVVEDAEIRQKSGLRCAPHRRRRRSDAEKHRSIKSNGSVPDGSPSRHSPGLMLQEGEEASRKIGAGGGVLHC